MSELLNIVIDGQKSRLCLHLAGPTWHQSRDGSVLLASRRYNGSRSRKTKVSLADTLQCNIWRRARIRQIGRDVAQSPSHARCTRRTRVCWYRIFFFGLIWHPSWPPWTKSCKVLSCNGRRIGQDHPDRLKLGPMALPRALYRTYSRVLKSDAHFQFSGAPKMTPGWTFGMRSCCGQRGKCSTHQHNLSVTGGC